MSKNILGKMVLFGLWLLLICIFLASLFYQQKENNVIYNKNVKKSLDNVFINETYTYLLKDDNLKELVFIKSEFMMPYVENIKNKNMTGYPGRCL
ncbi:hypothetical protein QIA30_05295 (plasmid) [Borreliella turdi]|uniref:hypothetical protein n=1 Tax=Borreliella turdi TaxID=57863 RepID=UPI003AF04540